LSLISIPTVSVSSGAVIALIGYIYQRRKYAKSIASQLGLESFSMYVRRGLGYHLVRYLRPRAAAKLSLRDFALNRLAADNPKVTVPAAIPAELHLDKMFVPLTARSSRQDRVDATQIAFGDHRRILLVGDPGSGKSTLVRRIYRDICRKAIAVSFAGSIPVLVELKDLDQQLESKSELGKESLPEFVRRQVTSVRTYSVDDLYESFLGAGRVTVLLDGLDEVKTSDFDAVAEEILRLSDHLARQGKDNRIIVTTRRQLYVNLPEEFLSSFETHLTLEPFTADDMYEFLSKWPYEQPPEQELARIFGNLVSQPHIRSMCQTPLILAMYVATDQLTRGEGLPETRPDFYTAVVDELLVRRRGRQLGLTTGLNLLRRNRQQILGRLALEHLLDSKQSRNALRWDAAVKIVQEQEGLSSDEAGLRLRELSRDTGLFTEERREESLRFIHLTFCEFLAAQAIVQGQIQAWETITKRIQIGTNEIGSERFAERFSEVVVFAAALEKNEQVRRERVQWAVQSGDTDLALRTILDSQPYDDELVLLELDRLANVVADTRQNDRGETWFYLFRQIAIVLRDRELVEGELHGRKRDLLAPFFLRAVGGSTTGFSQLFLSYMRLDPAGALDLARSMKIETVTEYPYLLAKALDEPAILTHALARFKNYEDGTKAWASVLAIGALYHHSVSQRLASMKADENLDQQLRHGGRRRGWQQCWAIRGTLLATVLEAGCRWPASSRALPFLATAPVRARRLTEVLLSMFLMDYLGVALVLLASNAVIRQFLNVRTVWVVVISVSLGLGFYTWRVLRKMAYVPTELLRGGLRAPPNEPEWLAALTPTYRTLEFLRQDLRRPLPKAPKDIHLPRQYRLRHWIQRHAPVLSYWSPNTRLYILVYILPYLLAVEVGDRASQAPPISTLTD
jgi:hypothetical protein